MKTISQVAKECGVAFQDAQKVADEFEINKRLFTRIETQLIQETLFNRGYFTYLTLESKMNYL